MDRAEALQVVTEICNVCNGVNIEGITLNKTTVTCQYTILLRVLADTLPMDLIEPILNTHNLVMRIKENFVFIHRN